MRPDRLYFEVVLQRRSARPFASLTDVFVADAEWVARTLKLARTLKGE